MTAQAEQPSLAGLAPRKRAKRKPKQRELAHHLPVAQVVLDVQATHLGRTFDYYVEEKDSETAQPGVMVRVRFGGQRLNGVIWDRAEDSDTDPSTIRYIERVISPLVVVPKQMREDISAIADAYGGTRANILRLAVPPRVASVENTFETTVGNTVLDDPDARARLLAMLDQELNSLDKAYPNWKRLESALEGERFQAFVLDLMAGPGRWQHDLAGMAATAMAQGKPVVLIMPTQREVEEMLHALASYGLPPFRSQQDGTYAGDVVSLTAQLTPPERFRNYMAIAAGKVRCVVGTRAAMYAPVAGHALFVVVDDAAYQNADGFMPYANARGVARLRAVKHQGVFIAAAQARSVTSQWETDATKAVDTLVCGPSTVLHATNEALEETTPNVRWLSRDALAKLADPTIGARIPHTAVTILSKALETGPVLLSIPHDGVSEALSCAECLQQARCLRCTGPLERSGTNAMRCRWCGAVAGNWHCIHCGSQRVRIVRVGATGTVQELQNLFRGVPIVVSSPVHGIVRAVSAASVMVIATPGAEPQVRGNAQSGDGYQAVAILDAWTSLYMPGMDAPVDTLTNWMHAVQYCVSREDGGQALILGQTETHIARALEKWDPEILAADELQERTEAGMPPAVVAAVVWGRRDAVMKALHNIGVLPPGDWSVVRAGSDDMPAVLGPRPIPPDNTIDARELENMGDRVKAVVRVSHQHRAELAIRLRNEVARHVTAREGSELRFQVDPKEVM